MGGEDQILDKLRTDRKNGIKSSNMESRGKFFGTNKKAKAKLKTLWAFFMEAMEDLTLRILCVAAVISIVVEMIHNPRKDLAWIEGAAIIIAILLSSGITTINDYNK